jgi:hypothetical protein
MRSSWQASAGKVDLSKIQLESFIVWVVKIPAAGAECEAITALSESLQSNREPTFWKAKL